ncbi:hypothetical protein Ddc_15145 [Ditylenchus destructor]|nr:hypothetical protein Ddc_15145 [Ditylenchus destructor]
MLSLFNKRAPSSSARGVPSIRCGVAWTSLLGKFASPDFLLRTLSDDANARGTFLGSFSSVKHRSVQLLFYGSSTLGSDGSVFLRPQHSAL